jgi:outer membrane protein assembly factor BamB
MERKLFISHRWLISISFFLISITGCTSTNQPGPPTTIPVTSTPQTLVERATPTVTDSQEAEIEPEVTATSTTIVEPTPTLEVTPIGLADTWVKTYGGIHENMSSEVLLATDGGYYTVGGIGKIYDDDREGGVLLLKTDEDGDIDWLEVYGGEEFDIGWSIIRAGDGNLVISGETNSYGAGGMDAYLIKVDPNGNEIWSKTYGTALDETVSTVKQTMDGGYLLIGNQVDPEDIIADPGAPGYAGFAGRSNIRIVKTDSDGNEVWSRTYDNDENIIAYSGLVIPDGGYVLLATITYFPGFDNDIFLLKIDQNGDEVWLRTFEEDAYAGYTIMETSDDHYLITGIYETNENPVSDLYLLKIDTEGHEVWRSVFGDHETYESGKALLETKEGNYLVLADTTPSLYSGKNNLLLFLVDDFGNLIWKQTLTIFYHSKAHTIVGLPDGGYLISGSTSSSGGTENTFLVKTDAYGNLSGGIETIPFP